MGDVGKPDDSKFEIHLEALCPQGGASVCTVSRNSTCEDVCEAVSSDLRRNGTPVNSIDLSIEDEGRNIPKSAVISDIAGNVPGSSSSKRRSRRVISFVVSWNAEQQSRLVQQQVVRQEAERAARQHQQAVRRQIMAQIRMCPVCCHRRAQDEGR